MKSPRVKQSDELTGAPFGDLLAVAKPPSFDAASFRCVPAGRNVPERIPDLQRRERG